MNTNFSIVIAVIAGFTGGCASVATIAGAHYQSVSVQAREQGQGEVAGVICELTNKNGKWFVTTPGSVMIARSNEDLQVICNKPELEPGKASVVSATKAAMFGNILIGGAIGAVVDHNDGSAYEYPEIIQINMGSSSRIEQPSLSDQLAQKKASNTSVALSQNMQAPQKPISHPSYTLLPTGAVMGDSPTLIKDAKAIPVKTASADAYFKKKKKGDACDVYISKGDYCWWSPPGNYSMCPLSGSLNACKASFGNGCQLGHGKVVPYC